MGLRDQGFIIDPGPFAAGEIPALQAAYEDAVASAASDEMHIGATNMRVGGLVNAGPYFDRIYVHPPLLAAASEVIGAPFKLSAFHARTIGPHAPAQALHQDFPPLDDGWPMVGFILMVDAFTEENGATRFLSPPRAALDEHTESVAATGAAGSMIIYNGSFWHGFGANRTAQPRRSIQGALIRRDQISAVDHVTRTRPETIARLSPTALDLLGF